MGSFYFVDFILFHKYLGISDMLSVEHSIDVQKRVEFNKPFDFVKIEFGEIGDFIDGLSKDKKHILWLDYDSVISESITLDLINALGHLSPSSIILLTLDVEPPSTEENTVERWKEYYFREVGSYIGLNNDKKHFAKSKLLKLNVNIIKNVISSAIKSRENLSFFPLFNFAYADGHKMITLGGMIGSKSNGLKLKSLDNHGAGYLRQSFDQDPYVIRVPKITKKERLYLDSAMPCSNDWSPEEFEFSPEDVKDYKEIYRYYPNYAELLL